MLATNIFSFSHSVLCPIIYKQKNHYFNPLPHMATLGSSNLAVNTDMMSKIWTNRDAVILIEWKTLCEKEKLLVTSNFFFSHNVYKSCLLLMHQNEYLWSKGLTTFVICNCFIFGSVENVLFGKGLCVFIQAIKYRDSCI